MRGLTVQKTPTGRWAVVDAGMIIAKYGTPLAAYARIDRSESENTTMYRIGQERRLRAVSSLPGCPTPNVLPRRRDVVVIVALAILIVCQSAMLAWVMR